MAVGAQRLDPRLPVQTVRHVPSGNVWFRTIGIHDRILVVVLLCREFPEETGQPYFAFHLSLDELV